MTQRRPAGFTLIELLVAVAVFAVLGALAYGGLERVLTTYTHIDQSTQRLQALQLTFRYLQRDLELLINRPVRDEFGDLQPALRSGEERGAQSWLSLTHAGWPNPAGLRRSTLQRVDYVLEENGDNEEEENLRRLAWPRLDGYGTFTEVEEDNENGVEDGEDEESRVTAGAIVTPLLTGIEEMQIRFLDEQNVWQDTWPPLTALDNPSQPVPLPRAVEITLTAMPWGELRRLIALPK